MSVVNISLLYNDALVCFNFHYRDQLSIKEMSHQESNQNNFVCLTEVYNLE